MAMKSEILALLRESGDYISGQELCNRFGVSRTAVWKVMKQLKEEGYIIEAVQNKGYRLTENPDVFSASELKSRIRNQWAGRELYFYGETGSTNTDAKRLGEEGAPHGTVVAADMQTAGRGRRGRTWESPAGKDIYFSILLRPEFAPDKAAGLTLVMALAVARAVEEKCGVEAGIKWPNDVVVNGKKICGILTEMTVETDYIQHVVTGVGINVNMDSLPERRRRGQSFCRRCWNGLRSITESTRRIWAWIPYWGNIMPVWLTETGRCGCWTRRENGKEWQKESTLPGNCWWKLPPDGPWKCMRAKCR